VKATRRLDWLMPLVLVASIVLTACGGEEVEVTQVTTEETVAETTDVEATVPPEPEEPKVVTMTYFEEPDTMNSLYSGMWYADITFDLFHLPMWLFDDKLEMVPEIAAEIPSVANGGLSDDGLQVTIKFRPEVMWSDGTPLTAHDYVFTYDMIMDNGNAVQSRYPFDTFVESVTAVDDHTLQVVMNEPYAAWYIGLNIRPLPKHVFEPVFEAEGTIDTAEWNRNPTVGDGPFVLTEWAAASNMVFDANPNYWRGKPMLDQILIRVTPDDEAQMAAIKTGDTDIGVNMMPSDKPDIDAIDDVELFFSGGGGWAESWFYNLVDEEMADETGIAPGHVALRDKRVRQALEHAINRQQIVDELFYGVYFVPKSFWYDTAFEHPDIEPRAYDPAAAMALLDEAGWVDSNGDGTRDKDGVELALRYSTTAGNELREAIQVVVQQSMAEIGVKMEILNYSYDVIWNGFGDGGPIAMGEYDIAEWSTQVTDYPDPNHVEYMCAEIPSQDYPAGNNWFGVCIEELDALFQEQAVTMDTAARIEMFHEIQEIMFEEALWLGIRNGADMWALNDRVKNVRFGADSFFNAYEWDVED
jgi:peptide/nickel transport system substrate-binding protein